MKYINKITGNPSQIFPSVQYKGEYDVSIYIGDPAGSALKEIELDAAKDRMIVKINDKEEEIELADTSLNAGNNDTAWYTNLSPTTSVDRVLQLSFSPYLQVYNSRNAFCNFVGLEKVTGLNLRKSTDFYRMFSNYSGNSANIYDIRTIDGGGHERNDGIYKDGDVCKVVIKNESGSTVSCEYMFQNSPRITDVSLSVRTVGSCRSTFQGMTNLTHCELILGKDYNYLGTNRTDSMFRDCTNLVSVTGYIEGHNIQRVNDMFKNCAALEDFCGIDHLGETFTYNAQYPNNCQLDLSMAPALSEQSVHDIVAKLGQIPAAQNIDYAWVKFEGSKQGILSAAEVAAAEAKGWQILYGEVIEQ